MKIMFTTHEGSNSCTSLYLYATYNLQGNDRETT